MFFEPTDAAGKNASMKRCARRRTFESRSNRHVWRNSRSLAKDHAQSLAALSRMLARRDGYLATFVHEGYPAELAHTNRTVLAAYFSVPLWWFGEDAADDVRPA